MKGESDTQPPNFVKSNGKTQCNYNIAAVQKTDERGTRTVYKYDYVEIEGEVTKLKFIDALDKAEKEKKDTEIWTPTDEYNARKVK